MAELQDIFNISFDEYRSSTYVPIHARKAAKAIMNCRTASLGGHIDRCPECGYEHNSYNSCRNRHCPKCQIIKKEQWIGRRCEEILDVRHFHMVFTTPAQLNRIVLQHPVIMYGLLFTASAETVKELAADPKHLGACTGFTSILHTWGQNLSFHPHIHMVAAGGRMTPASKWKYSCKKFFLPVKVVSKLFRGKFLAALRKLLDKGKLVCRDSSVSALNLQILQQIIAACYEKDWCVYCKKPFRGTAGVFSYLGRYNHRVAITNNQILEVDKEKTRFSWRNYSDGNTVKEMVLSNKDFIRRFLFHILPHGFTRIRHYGHYASRNKTSRLAVCRRSIDSSRKTMKAEASSFALISRIIGRDVSRCPNCGKPLVHYALARDSSA